MRSLWPADLADVEERAPALLLREQAAYLGIATDNIVVGKVNRLKRAGKDEQDPTFVYGFYLVASALDNYTYRLFAIKHHVDLLYPVSFILDDALEAELTNAENDRGLVAKSEKEYLEILERIFSTDRTRQIVQSLVAQSERFTPPTEEEDDIPF